MNKSFYIFWCLVAVLSFFPQHTIAQWIQTNGTNGGNFSSFGVNGVNIFAGTFGTGMFRSVNNGANWSAIDSGLTHPYVSALAIRGGNLFAGTLGAGVFLSTNNGGKWSAMSSGLPINTAVNALVVSSTRNIFAGILGAYEGVFIGYNNGENWFAAGLSNTSVYALAVIDTNLFAGTFYGVFHSTDNGVNWSNVNHNIRVNVFVVSGNNLFAGADGVFFSTDNGANWNDAGLPITHINALAVSGKNLFAGSKYGGIFLSTDNGVNWSAVDSGLTNDSVNVLAVIGTNLFAGIVNNGVWRRPLSDMVTTVSDLYGEDNPHIFSLSQNYPNPFNPTTTISYALPQSAHVTLEVYNTLGERVALLVDEQEHAGYHNVEFRTTGLASGVYYYRISAGSFMDVKKLVLMK
ncbi:MAG: T9SS type A sorting domain-containing protein [Bacteroidota bacterium]